ncbi:hypothetical protein AU252_15635 [Pseudarthrobacter sulfonivorans]|uniref:Histidine kinase n=1 Tax=Pseudarthrobacter sulfonivorans TaxID=121292 RepID=A0A0U3QPY6_9MICC|nr:hypothetical protein [Pseudarthrobacter sulfonivorans]ALV42404.1 hypothetical protein AU252_15635 [Pseudarthrobacter sulfonivorans]
MIRAISTKVMAALCAAFVAVHIALGLLSLDMVSAVWPVLLAMAIYLIAVVVVLRPCSGRLPLPATVFVLMAVTALTLLITSVLPTDRWPGYASWHLAATYTVLVAINIRGQVLLSWIGVLLSVVLNTLWASQTTMGFVGGLMLNIATVGWVTVSTGIGHLLRTNDRKVGQYRADAEAAADWFAAEQALHVARTNWLEHVRTVAGPALGQIADANHDITEIHRIEFQLAEAQFRDEIRGRVLATAEVVEAARRARQRGVTVQLLDDRRQNLTPRTLAAVSERVVSILNQARTGTVTARARPQGGDQAVTIYAAPENPDEATFVEFTDRSPEP